MILIILFIELLALLLMLCTNDLSNHSKGWVIYKGRISYCDGDGGLYTGLCRIGDNYYYFNESGSNKGVLFRKGYKLIDGDPYYFTKRGKAAKEGWVSDNNGAKFYCKGDGQLKTGWMALQDVAYYFYKPDDGKDFKIGELAKDYKFSESIYIPESGCIDGEEGKALSYGIKVLDQEGWNLKAAYKYAGRLKYSGRYDRYDYLIHKCAIQGFENQTGNCLVWMGCFCTLARLMKYDCQVVWGFIIHKGEEIPHSWTEIKESDGVYVYDPRKANGKNLSGYHVMYGQRGTYNYVESKKTYLKW